MQPDIRVYLYDEEGNKFFGDGPCKLLLEIERTGSLKSAAESMNMAYTKSLALIKNAESALGFPLTHRVIGGKGGGGSQLTPKAKEFLADYEAYRTACRESNRRIYQEIFSGKS